MSYLTRTDVFDQIADFLVEIFNSTHTEIRNKIAGESIQIALLENIAVKIDPLFLYKWRAIEGDKEARESLRKIRGNKAVIRDIEKILKKLSDKEEDRKIQKECLIVDIQAQLQNRISILILEWLSDNNFKLLIATCAIVKARSGILRVMLDPEIGGVDGNSFVPYTCSGEHTAIESSLLSLAMSVEHKAGIGAKGELVTTLLDLGASAEQECTYKTLEPVLVCNSPELKQLEESARSFIEQEFRKKNPPKAVSLPKLWAKEYSPEQERTIEILQQTACKIVRTYFLEKKILPLMSTPFEDTLKVNEDLRTQLLSLLEKTGAPKIGVANLSGDAVHLPSRLRPLEKAIMSLKYKTAIQLLIRYKLRPLPFNIPKNLLLVLGNLYAVNVAELLYERAIRKLVTTDADFIDIVTTLQLVIQSYPDLLTQNCLNITPIFNGSQGKQVSVVSKIILDILPVVDIEQADRKTFIIQRLLFDSGINIFAEVAGFYSPYKIFTMVNEPNRSDPVYDYYIAARDMRCRYIALLWPKDLSSIEKKNALGIQIAESHNYFMMALEKIQQLYNSFSSSIMQQVISGTCSNKSLPEVSKICELYNSSMLSRENGLTQLLDQSFYNDHELFKLLLNALLYGKIQQCGDEDGFTFNQEKNWWVHYILGWITQNHPEFFNMLPCFTQAKSVAVVQYENTINPYPIPHSGMLADFSPRYDHVKKIWKSVSAQEIVMRCDFFDVEQFEFSYKCFVDELKDRGRFKTKPQVNQLVLQFSPSNTAQLKELRDTFVKVRDQRISLEKYVEQERVYWEIARPSAELPMESKYSFFGKAEGEQRLADELRLSMKEKSAPSLKKGKECLLGQVKLRQFRNWLQGRGVKDRYLQNYIIAILVQQNKESLLLENKGKKESRVINVLFSVQSVIIEQLLMLVKTNDRYTITVSQKPHIEITYDKRTHSATVQITSELHVVIDEVNCSKTVKKFGNIMYCVRLFENAALLPDLLECRAIIRPLTIDGLDIMQEMKNFLTTSIASKEFSLFNLIFNDADGANSLKAIKSIEKVIESIEINHWQLLNVEYLQDLYKLVYKKIAIADDPIVVNRWLSIVDIFKKMIPVEIQAKIETTFLSDRYLSSLETHIERLEYWIEALTLAEQITALLNIGNHRSPYAVVSLNMQLISDLLKQLLSPSGNALDKLVEMKKALELPENLDAKQLEFVIQVFGPYIERLYLNNVNLATKSNLQQMIAKKCPQLVEAKEHNGLFLATNRPLPCFATLPPIAQYTIFKFLPEEIDRKNYTEVAGLSMDKLNKALKDEEEQKASSHSMAAVD